MKPASKKHKKDLDLHKRLELNFRDFIDLKRREDDPSTAPIFKTGERPKDQAIRFSLDNGLLPVFAIDTYGATKSYCVCSYGKMKNVLLRRGVIQKNHFYEVTLPIPSKIFIDVDIDLRVNHNLDFEKIQADFFDFAADFFLEKGLVKKKADLDITILDSSHEEKISRHYIFKILNNKKQFFRNPYHCGSFIRQLQNFIFEKKECITDPSKSRFWFNLKNPPNNQGDYGHFICDLGIYNLHRVFRTVLSEKLPDPKNKNKKTSPKLLPWPKDLPLKDDFSDYFAQSGISINEDEIIDFPEVDGSDPKSTNNVAIFRIDKINRGITVQSSEMASFYRTTFPFEKVWELFGDVNRQFRFEFFNFKVESGVIHSKLTKFDGLESFRRYVREKVPACIHISSILDEEQGSKKKEVRELVIDIDKTDYSFLTCCGKDDPLCRKCFLVIKLALLISSIYFRDILGYKHVRFFFSGKKGFHGWIFDEDVTNLSSEEHKKICEPLLKYDEKKFEFFSRYLLSLYSIRSLLEELKKTFPVPSTATSPLEFFWIRLDDQVSFSVNHSAKCPWAIHKSSRSQSFEINDVEMFSFRDIVGHEVVKEKGG